MVFAVLVKSFATPIAYPRALVSVGVNAGAFEFLPLGWLGVGHGCLTELTPQAFAYRWTIVGVLTNSAKACANTNGSYFSKATASEPFRIWNTRGDIFPKTNLRNFFNCSCSSL